MTEVKLQECPYEGEAWKRTLDSLGEESSRLQGWLSEIREDQSGKNYPDDVKGFQNRLSDEDQLIGFLREAIAEIEQSIIKDRFIDRRMVQHLIMKIRNLRDYIEKAERQLGNLKSEFNNYLPENTKHKLKKGQRLE